MTLSDAVLTIALLVLSVEPAERLAKRALDWHHRHKRQRVKDAARKVMQQ